MLATLKYEARIDPEVIPFEELSPGECFMWVKDPEDSMAVVWIRLMNTVQPVNDHANKRSVFSCHKAPVQRVRLVLC